MVRSFCADQGLDCQVTISRLDFGGVTLTDFAIADAGTDVRIARAARLAVDLAWSAPWSVRPDWVGGDDVEVRVNLTGEGEPLGRVGQILSQPREASASRKTAMPRLDFRSLRLVADTLVGPVEATGELISRKTDSFHLDLRAAPLDLKEAAGQLRLAEAMLSVRGEGAEISGEARFDLPRMTAQNVDIEGARLNLAMRQTGGGLAGAGAFAAQTLRAGGVDVSATEARADIQAAALDLSSMSLDTLLLSLRKVAITGQSGSGAFGSAAWSSGKLDARIDSQEGGAAGGDVSIIAERVKLPVADAERLEVDGAVQLSPGPDGGLARAFDATGTARLIGASLNEDTSASAGDRLKSALGAVLPSFGDAASRALRRAGEHFELALPWSFRVDDGGYDASALPGVTFHADSGMSGAITAEASPAVFRLSSRGGLSWDAVGALELSGGGAPDLVVRLLEGAGGTSSLTAVGSAEIRSWRVGDDTLAMQARQLSFRSAEGSGVGVADVRAQVTGAFAGGRWTGATASGAVKADWTPAGYQVEAPDGMSLSWKEARYGETVIGAGKLTYSANGPLARQEEGRAVGQGVLSGLDVPVNGAGYTARAHLPPATISWSMQDEIVVDAAMRGAGVDLLTGDGEVPVRLGKLETRLRLGRGWSATGAFTDGAVEADTVHASGVAARYSLAGAGDRLSGSLDDVKVRLSDPLTGAGRRYEDVNFEGRARLADSKADFSGGFTLVQSGVSLGAVTGVHDLGTGTGEMSLAPTVFVFRPRSFQPYAISPLLRGPANVQGQVEVSGGATWSSNGLQMSAAADIRKLGFAIATAGVFEGVSGRIVVDDLLHMHSPPGQALTVDRVTLGIPFDNGRIGFQLDGFDRVRLEGASWPFAGGEIQVLPTDFVFTAQQNRVVAHASDWNLRQLVEAFKIPDLALQGSVNGDIPLVFSTGSARIDHALLKASDDGGVIQYTGGVGEAAAGSDPNVQMLFGALRNFRFKVLSVELDGDVLGRIMVKANIAGSNVDQLKTGAIADIVAGTPFDLNIGIDSDLLDLLNTVQRGNDGVDAVVRSITGASD
ncbi:MAG: YdbH domain-containing protein [Hyphomonadaceae bacterium]